LKKKKLTSNNLIMEFKGTKGTWYIEFMVGETIKDELPDFWVKSNHNDVVNYGTDILSEDYGEQNGYPKQQRYADAQLIAAAPELLEALISAVDEFTGTIEMSDAGTSNPVWIQMNEAINKALGK